MGFFGNPLSIMYIGHLFFNRTYYVLLYHNLNTIKNFGIYSAIQILTLFVFNILLLSVTNLNFTTIGAVLINPSKHYFIAFVR